MKNILYGYYPANHSYALVVETPNLKMRLFWSLQRLNSSEMFFMSYSGLLVYLWSSGLRQSQVM